MATTINYISETNKNTDTKNNIYNATVVANYGDPGLTQDYFADILSRYVICCIESSARTLTNDKWPGMLVVVERPDYLWIDYSSNVFVNNPNAQSRTDFNLNTNTGPSASYTVNTISPINTPYYLGETIQIREKKDNNIFSVSNQENFFTSACPANIYNSSTYYYGSWHSQGLNSNPYIQQNNNPPTLTVITIAPVSYYPTNNPIANNNQYLYNMALNKIQYEAFALTQYPEMTGSLVSLFKGTSDYQYYYQGHGGYAYYQNFNLFMPICQFEDINQGQKARIPNVNCLPLIVAAPSTFSTPAVRSPSTINYSPTVIIQG